MTGTFKLAWRNLGRNRRRTVITSVALAVGMCLCVASYGWMDGMNADILHALTRLDLGHVQAHHPKYPRNRKLQLTLQNPEELEQRARALPGVLSVTTRLYGFGLASHGSKSAGVELVGVDPTSEPRVTELNRTVRAGHYLDPKPTPWPWGERLSAKEQAEDARLTRQAEAQALAEIAALGGDSAAAPPGGPSGRAAPAANGTETSRQLAAKMDPPPQRPPEVLIGADLARILKAKPGDQLYLISQTVDGESTEVSFRLQGVFKTGTSQYDRSRAYVNLADLQRFLRLRGQVHELALRAKSASQAQQLARELSAKVNGAAVMVRSWDTIRPDIKNMLQLNSASMVLMVGIIFLVAAIFVVNTMLMAVFERTRELGMLKAIGMSGWRILGLVLAETTLLVLVASFFGVLLGLGVDLYLMVYGIDLGNGGISIGGMGLSPTLHAVITVQGVVAPVVVLSLMCFIGALYPGIRAARMRPAQGMREV